MALVTYVLGDCPSCGAKGSFGNVDVYETHVYRGCKCCRHHERVNLPPLKKKVLYLDQFFFSGAFRAGDKRFVEAAGRIERLAALQLLLVPFSSIHEDETHQWEKRDELFKFIRATARGEEFEAAYDVERTQLEKAFRAWLAGSPPEYNLERRDALEEETDKWDGYLRFDVGRYSGDIDLIRNLKMQTTAGLVDMFDGWRKLAPAFDQDLQAEYEVAGQNYVNFYLDFAVRISKGDYAAVFDAPIVSMVVQTLMFALPDDMPFDQKLEWCREFLASEHFKVTPYQWLTAHMLATLKTMVKDGAYINRGRALQRLSGFFYDVKHIATYAPYVDAFVMDQPMADLVGRPTVDLEQRFGARVFSLNNWNDLMTWLDGVEAAGMTDAHRQGLAAAYPGLRI